MDSKTKPARRSEGQIDDPAEIQACREHREALLDEALMESFPASDPPSIARPAAKGC